MNTPAIIPFANLLFALLGKALMQHRKKTFDAVFGSYMLALRLASSSIHRQQKTLLQRKN
ncbi:hypothetical protein [Burkholderia sp. Ac-20344]|uniref:hypothetical protein n=1 Tax=Burkholderia sp. Ac-20344 TaxID=2703890 RepID=UPI00197BB87A|nr:hypothetical protein [Burkholderia sp. Ac-20344]MBN3836981.1 hypothetical protein [Burkholderia sp. Ac-20344]